MKGSPDQNLKKKKMFFARGAGIVIVGFWLVMMGLLIAKHAFKGGLQQPAKTAGKAGKTLVLEGPEHEWMEIFLHDRKIGYSRSTIQPLEEGYVIQEALFLRLNLLGRPSLIRSETRALVDHEFRLRHFNFSLQSGVTSFSLRGDVRDHWMIIKRRGSPEKKIRTEGPLYIGASLSYFFKKEPFAVGKSFSIQFFDPSTLARKQMVIRVVGQETTRIHRIAYKTYRLETRLMGQLLSFWVDENGNLLKESGLLGMTLVRSNPTQAQKDISGTGGEDFYELASVHADRRLPRPREMRWLKVKLDGIDGTSFSTSVLNDQRQEYEKTVLTVTRETIPSRNSSPFSNGNRAADMGSYLKPEINIEVDDPEIKRIAKKIAGRDQDPARVARRLLAWVYVKVNKRPVMSVPSAREVLKTRAGDCNEHAVLLTALLRASGIPARLCVGLVYAKGKFYYHAWTEGWVGKWISMDATLNQMPVDATHITLARGGLENQTAIIALMGKLNVKVLDYSYD